jgi:LacI family transcriptional regulator
MACYDIRGWQLLEVCRRIGVAVPDEVAIIGVDNDELLCNLSDPPLSSVAPDTHRTGYEAARLLDQWMQGECPEAVAHLIDPLGVITRQSTDVLAIEDRIVSQAVHFIRNHACDGIKMEDVLREIPVSRRVLEHRFKSQLGRTPHEEIVKVQFQRVVQLLVETSLSLEAIARRTGFKHAEYFSVAFKQQFGMPPSRYRKMHNQRIGERHSTIDPET